MFSGIVAAVGRISSSKTHGDGVRMRVDAPGFGMDDVAIGDSIAVQGVCLTVVARDPSGFEAEVSQATLGVTNGLEQGREVNLEKSLRMADRIGGHLVAGHVDAVGTVAAFDDLGASQRMVVEVPQALSRFIARKASVAVDGVSLTTNAVDRNRFEVNVIPHTLSATTLRALRAGSRVNVEVDLLARYLDRLIQK
jgi:riboflavin synthase